MARKQSKQSKQSKGRKSGPQQQAQSGKPKGKPAQAMTTSSGLVPNSRRVGKSRGR